MLYAQGLADLYEDLFPGKHLGTGCQKNGAGCLIWVLHQADNTNSQFPAVDRLNFSTAYIGKDRQTDYMFQEQVTTARLINYIWPDNDKVETRCFEE